MCKSLLKCTKCDQIFDKLHTYHGHVNICDRSDKYQCSGCGLCDMTWYIYYWGLNPL